MNTVTESLWNILITTGVDKSQGKQVAITSRRHNTFPPYALSFPAQFERIE